MKWILAILFGRKGLPAPEHRAVVQNEGPRRYVPRTA